MYFLPQIGGKREGFAGVRTSLTPASDHTDPPKPSSCSPAHIPARRQLPALMPLYSALLHIEDGLARRPLSTDYQNRTNMAGEHGHAAARSKSTAVAAPQTTHRPSTRRHQAPRHRPGMGHHAAAKRHHSTDRPAPAMEHEWLRSEGPAAAPAGRALPAAAPGGGEGGGGGVAAC